MRFYEIDQSGTRTHRPKRELPPEEALASDGDSAPDVKDEALQYPGNAVVFLLLAIIKIVFIAVASLQAPAVSDDESWSLRGISVEIPAEQKVSVCGRTDSGKSTFLLSLLRMVEIPISTAYIGGRDHSQLPSQLCDVDEQIKEVLAECGLQQVVEVCGGLNASAANVQLSIGETQFLSLTRVILYGSSRPGRILLLDEATSSLDNEAQQRMKMLIEAKFQDKTIISVCHKLPWALKSDRIIVLGKGRDYARWDAARNRQGVGFIRRHIAARIEHREELPKHGWEVE
ncbi:hypothetical protein MY10362_009202 [Beauveria mimosiformis]